MTNFKKKALTASVALALGLGFGTAQAIEVAADNAGQLLLGPYYAAEAVVTTDITVVNPDLDRAVKAHITFRSKLNSKEVLDFVIYLSPGDVFRGELKDGKFYSTDDSVKALRQINVGTNPGWANELGAEVSLAAVAKDNSNQGHIEVYGMYSAEGTVTLTDGSSVQVKRGMTKAELAKVFDTDIADLRAIAANQPLVVANNPATVQISGEVAVNFPSGQKMLYPFTALDASAAGQVVSNDEFDTFRFGSTGVGQNIPVGKYAGAAGADNLYLVEAALSADRLFGAYESYKEGTDEANTTLLVNFPTKYRHDPAYTDYIGNVAPFRSSTRTTGDGTCSVVAAYSFSSYNNTEETVDLTALISPYTPYLSTLCETEIVNPNFVVNGTRYSMDQNPEELATYLANKDSQWIANNPKFLYDSGWYNVDMRAAAGSAAVTGYTGIPVIAYTVKANVAKQEVTLIPAAKQ